MIGLAWPWAILALLVAMAGCAHKTQISGTIDTADYVIPAGAVVTAVGDVTIAASHRIEIDGTLYIAPGATVTFKSPSVNTPGTVQNMGMHVDWWRRSEFFINRIPGAVTARVDRMLGRTPNYWNRGSLDCFNPVGRAQSLAAAQGGSAPASLGSAAR